MRLLSFKIFFLLCLLMPTYVQAQEVVVDSSVVENEGNVKPTRYDNRIHRYRRYWGAIIPTQTVLQTCGNMGLVSLGVGWDYGKHRQWETQLLIGFIPKYDSSRGKVTMTLKQNFIPWSMPMGHGWSFEPLSVACTSIQFLVRIFGPNNHLSMVVAIILSLRAYVLTSFWVSALRWMCQRTSVSL